MANCYTKLSKLISISLEDKDRALTICQRVRDELLEEEGYIGYIATWLDFPQEADMGVWIRDDESVTQEHVERLVRALVDELPLAGQHVCRWAYTCGLAYGSTARSIGAFGGGAFAVEYGKPTVWIDAANEALHKLKKL